VSVDGFLARPDDALDFLHTGEQEPHGFKEFLASVDVVVIGRRTFDVVLKLGHLALYGKKPVVVLSSRPLDFSSVKGGVVEQMSGEPAEIVKQLKSKGDARCLSAQSNSADAVLLLGPLYHLVERSDRLMALREARRILKPKGVLIAAAISRFASLIDGLARGFFRDSDFRKIVASDLATGQHRNPTNQTAYFTTAYFHHPEELAAEVREASFTDI
jgi:SAM-dependent methyltransferase